MLKLHLSNCLLNEWMIWLIIVHPLMIHSFLFYLGLSSPVSFPVTQFISSSFQSKNPFMKVPLKKLLFNCSLQSYFLQFYLKFLHELNLKFILWWSQEQLVLLSKILQWITLLQNLLFRWLNVLHIVK